MGVFAVCSEAAAARYGQPDDLRVTSVTVESPDRRLVSTPSRGCPMRSRLTPPCQSVP